MLSIDKPKNYVWGILEGTNESVPIFTMAPYRNVAVRIGEVKIFEKGFAAEWRLLRNPTEMTDHELSEDPGFNKYLKEIIKDILETDGHVPDKKETA